MTLTLLLPLALFAFVSSITPGPNNVMLTASGATFGYRRTLPHMLGISAGVAVMLLMVGAGLGTVFETMPVLYSILKYVGAGYLLYLAWRIASANGMDGAAARSKPFTFLEAAAFQWVNPKAWIMSVGMIHALGLTQGVDHVGRHCRHLHAARRFFAESDYGYPGNDGGQFP